MSRVVAVVAFIISRKSDMQGEASNFRVKLGSCNFKFMLSRNEKVKNEDGFDEALIPQYFWAVIELFSCSA